MEEDLFDMIKKTEADIPAVAPQFAKQFPDISFVPQEEKKLMRWSLDEGILEKCAVIGIVFGAVSLVAWAIILFGVFLSTIGIAFSLAGARSSYVKYSRIGLVLSVIGLVASIGYLYAIYSGHVNYDYFTGEFWGIDV